MGLKGREDISSLPFTGINLSGSDFVNQHSDKSMGWDSGIYSQSFNALQVIIRNSDTYSPRFRE